ncbi:MAG: hypothetical protein IT445_20980 [Phycisphaeraceae bacterium]|nr:hypothetical protein [Phycisphaeraceae bacterium]
MVDGNSYHGCVFIECTLIFSGGALPMFADSQFNKCQWQFDDAASRTVAFMNALYQGGATDLIEQIFCDIKTGK